MGAKEFRILGEFGILESQLWQMGLHSEVMPPKPVSLPIHGEVSKILVYGIPWRNTGLITGPSKSPRVLHRNRYRLDMVFQHCGTNI